MSDSSAYEAIRIIESLYPPDSEFYTTAEIGIELLQSVCGDTPPEEWRMLPYEKLIRLCMRNLEEAGEQEHYYYEWCSDILQNINN